MVTTYEYDAANRLTSVNGVVYTWDDRGNLINDGMFTYAQATPPGGTPGAAQRVRGFPSPALYSDRIESHRDFSSVSVLGDLRAISTPAAGR